MTLIRWEPFRELDEIFAHTSLLFGRPAAVPAWTPTSDVSETDADYLIRTELPDVAKEDIAVTVELDVITIRGERRQEAERKDEKVHRIESHHGSFSRSFRLPDDADVSAIRAESRNGVLKVRVPKKPALRAKKVEVQVN